MKYCHHLFTILLLSIGASQLSSCYDQNALEKSEKELTAASAPKSEYQPETMDISRSDTPVMPLAEYITIEFAQSSAELSVDAQENLRELSRTFNDNEPVLLTVHMEDEDKVNATEPKEDFKRLTGERVTAVKKHLQENGVAIEQVKVNETGAIDNIGEGSAMARGSEATPENARVLIVTITTQN